MRNGIRIGRLFGIELRVDASWLVILVLVVWSLSSLFASWHPDWSPFTSFGVAVAAALAFFASVLFHEMAHSVVALVYGIPVRDITLHMFGGVSNIEKEPPTPRSEFLMAVVGPLASIGLGAALMIFGAVITDIFAPEVTTPEQAIASLGPVSTAIMWLGPINVMVGVFNLVPGFPLDGGRILRSILWKLTGNLTRATRYATNAGQAVGWAFIGMGALMVLGFRIPFFGSGITGGLWIALIGLFLRNAAVQHHRGAIVQDALAGVRVADLMRRRVNWIDASTSLRRLVDNGILAGNERAFPVYDGPHMVGLLTVADIRKVGPSDWESRVVRDVMTPKSRVLRANPDEPISDALRRMGGALLEQIPVMVDEHVLGMLFESDVAHWLALQTNDGRPQRIIRTRHA